MNRYDAIRRAYAQLIIDRMAQAAPDEDIDEVIREEAAVLYDVIEDMLKKCAH